MTQAWLPSPSTAEPFAVFGTSDCSRLQRRGTVGWRTGVQVPPDRLAVGP